MSAIERRAWADIPFIHISRTRGGAIGGFTLKNIILVSLHDMPDQSDKGRKTLLGGPMPLGNVHQCYKRALVG